MILTSCKVRIPPEPSTCCWAWPERRRAFARQQKKRSTRDVLSKQAQRGECAGSQGRDGWGEGTEDGKMGSLDYGISSRQCFKVDHDRGMQLDGTCFRHNHNNAQVMSTRNTKISGFLWVFAARHRTNPQRRWTQFPDRFFFSPWNREWEN